MVSDHLLPRWLVYVLISSLLCVCGGLCVPLISYAFSRRQNVSSKLLNYGLSLSAGSMITTALYKMLPRDSNEGTESLTVFSGMMIGMVLSLGLNYVIHAFASESMVHCAHSSGESTSSGEEHSHSHEPEEESPLNAQKHAVSHHQRHQQQLQVLHSKPSFIDMLSPVGANSVGDCRTMGSCVPVVQQDSFTCRPPPLDQQGIPRSLSCGDGDQHSYLEAQGLSCLENHVGYDLENLPVYRHNFHSQRYHNEPASEAPTTGYDSLPVDDSYRHHHHLETPFSKLLSIGMQTCIVITLHKFPEGFILYYTNRSSQVSKDLGFSIFLSLTIHNFVEGFSMTLPLYAAFESKLLALSVTTVLGGCSQPLGAFIGYLIFKDKHVDPSRQPHMDLYLSVTAGFLLVIGLQMFQTGVGFSQGHHHHQGEAEKELRENHSLGTTCLKWSCAGVLLVLASGLFK